MLGELDDAMRAARASKTVAYIEIIGGKLDMPPALAFAHGRLNAMYGKRLNNHRPKSPMARAAVPERAA